MKENSHGCFIKCFNDPFMDVPLCELIHICGTVQLNKSRRERYRLYLFCTKDTVRVECGIIDSGLDKYNQLNRWKRKPITIQLFQCPWSFVILPLLNWWWLIFKLLTNTAIRPYRGGMAAVFDFKGHSLFRGHIHHALFLQLLNFPRQIYIDLLSIHFRTRSHTWQGMQ